MSNEKIQVVRTEGWDQEKNEYFERVDCPVCGYRATRYEKGDIMVEREGDPSCSVCSEAFGAPVVPEDYGTSWATMDDEGTGGCFLLAFAAIAVPVLLVWFLIHLFGTQ